MFTMKLSQIQFQPSLSLSDFLLRYGTEFQCEAALWKKRFGPKVLSARTTMRKATTFSDTGQGIPVQPLPNSG